MTLHCFMQTQHPVPGSDAAPVHYPVCEWVGEGGQVDLQHPINRFVCAWLTSDVNTIEHCQDVLAALGQVASGQRTHWAVDGEAFNVDVHPSGLQFNFSHVGPDDAGWWNLPEACFALAQVRDLLSAWCAYLREPNRTD